MASGRVLLVEDEPAIRLSISDFLGTHGLEVDDASSCAAAEDSFRQSPPDMTILDDSLPDGNALDLMRRLRACDPGAPLLVLAGHGAIDQAVQAIKEGAELSLTKPVQLPALLAMIERLLENRRHRARETADRGTPFPDESGDGDLPVQPKLLKVLDDKPFRARLTPAAEQVLVGYSWPAMRPQVP